MSDPPTTQAAGPRPPLLRVEGMTKAFGRQLANDGISFSVARGEVHGVLGENGAGKTTLMNLIFGSLQPDAGRVEIDGVEVRIASPRDALVHGIGMVHQHFMLVEEMTIAENVAVALGRRQIARSKVGEVEDRLRKLSEEYGLDVDPRMPIEEASIGTRQKVEILKLLYRGAELLILDEPTGALAGHEWEHLSGVLRALTAADKSVILITHKLDELLGVASRYTVLRDGRVVGGGETAGTSKADLAEMMVGREVLLRVTHERRTPGECVLEARDVGSEDGSGRALLTGINLEVREREIVGIAGVDGNGQGELVEVLTGMAAVSSGEVRIDGTPLDGRSPRGYRAAGGAVVPADRHRSAIVAEMSVAENLVLKCADESPFSRRGLLARRPTARHARALIEEYDIRVPGESTPISALSGGNQQKAVLARELWDEPRVLIASHPTRGLDIGAVESVYHRLLAYRDAGGGILLISNELDEIISLADRIAVMVDGKFAATLAVEDAEAKSLGLLMAGEEVADSGSAVSAG